MIKSESCQCGWHRGHDPTQVLGPDGKYYFVGEEPKKAPRNEGLAAAVLGVVLFIAGVAGGGGGLIVFGLVCVTAGVTTLVITKMGTLWKGLQPHEQAAAWPGRIIGWVPLAFVVLLIGLMAFIGNLFT
ncbi:hypothetical protein [Streptomyces sp. XH2]|uniref:hypothetical protein n=1 Tax=Streptomyces sp. XH2 TaxID=3412483 RepID=UPI003C7DE612